MTVTRIGLELVALGAGQMACGRTVWARRTMDLLACALWVWTAHLTSSAWHSPVWSLFVMMAAGSLMLAYIGEAQRGYS